MGKPLVHMMAELGVHGVSFEPAEERYVNNLRWAVTEANKLGL